jgi:hypothetical protein
MAKSNRPVIIAAIGGVVLLAGVVAFIASSLSSDRPSADTPTSTPAPSFDASDYDADELKFVYPQVIELGLVPEPITTDPKEYIADAVAAWGTFDTTGGTTIPQWKKYLESWQNVYPLVVERPAGDPVHFDPPEENPVTRVSPVDHRDLWVIGEAIPGAAVAWTPADWDLIQSREGKVVTEATSIGKLEPVMGKTLAGLGERETTVEFTQWVTMDDGTDADQDITFTKHGTARITVNCTTTTPAPDSAQRPGDCKIMSVLVLDYK